MILQQRTAKAEFKIQKLGPNMDRSTARQSYMRTSYVFNNNGSNTANRSFISTALMSDSLAYGDDLRKSRIQNLPNYKKTNLGDNIQFIVVFQTIEIERLSNEVQVLRVKLKESHRQLGNAQNYEVQIRELTEKCFSLERLREDYCEEIEKLTKICDTLFHENQALKSKLNEMDYSLKQKFQLQKQKNQDLNQQIQKWKARYQAAEKSKAKQLQDLRNLMECQRKSMIDREIRQITIRFQNDRSSLENQIRKNRENIENRNRQIDDLRQKCQKYEISIMELKNYENVIADNENKIVLLNQELIRLNDVLARKEDQLQRIKEREYKLKEQLKEQQEWEFQNKQLRGNLDNKNKENEEWRVRCQRLEDEVNKSREMVYYNQELTNKVQLTSTQIERLNKVLRAKLDEIEEWKNKVQKRDLQIAKLKDIQSQLPNFENKLSMLAAQNNRLDGILKSRITEIQQWKNKCTQLQDSNKDISRLNDEKRNLQDKLNYQVRNSDELSRNILKYEQELDGMRNIESQANELQRQNGIMNKEIERLNGVIRNYSNEIDDYRVKESRYEKTLSQFKNSEQDKRDLTHKINILTQEKERLNNLIRTKNQDIENLQNEKVQLHSKINHYKNYETKISESEGAANKLKQQINRLRGEVEGWQNKANTADNKSREFQHHLFISNNEKQKLNSMLRNKNNEYDDLRGKYARMEGDSRKIAQMQNFIQQQNNQLSRYMEDLQHFQRNKIEYAQELEREKQVSNEFAYKIIVLSCELERISGAGGGRGGINSREYQQLQQDYSRLQSKVISKNNEIDILNNRISNLEIKVNELVCNFNQIIAQVQKSEEETRSLYSRIEEYQDYAKRIHILSAEIDRLQAQNKAFDEDARKIRLKFANGLAVEKKQEDFQFVLVLMALEIQNLRNRLDQREINMDQMRKSILEPVRRI